MAFKAHSGACYDFQMLMLCMLYVLIMYKSEAVATFGICGGDLVNNSGAFKNPNRSELLKMYPHISGSSNLSCTWRIIQQQGVIKLVFDRLQTGEVPNGCGSLVSLVVIDKASLSNSQPTETQICRQELPFTFYSKGATLDVVLKGQLLHPYYENYSFSASYSAPHSTTITLNPCGPCGGILSGSSGSIRSPNYPKNYPDNCDCKWTVYAQSGYIVKFKFWEFSLEPEENLVCHDYVAIYDGTSMSAKSLGKFCGQRNPGSLMSTGRYSLVHFHSDVSKSSTGFEVMYEFSKDGEDLTSLRSIAAILGGVSFGIFIFLLLCSVIYKKYMNSQERRDTCQPSNNENDYLDAVQAAAPPSYQTVMADPEHYPRTPEITPSPSPVVTPSLLRRSLAHSIHLIHNTNIHHLDSLEEVPDNGLETPPPPYPGDNGEDDDSDNIDDANIEDLPPPPTYAMVSENEEEQSLNTWTPVGLEEFPMVDRGVDRRRVMSGDRIASPDRPASTVTHVTSCEDNFNSDISNEGATRTISHGEEICDNHANEEFCLQCIENSEDAPQTSRGASGGDLRGDYTLLRTDNGNENVNSHQLSRRGHSVDSMHRHSEKRRFKGSKDRSLSVPSLHDRTERSECGTNHSSGRGNSSSWLRSLFSRRNQSHMHNRVQPNNPEHEQSESTVQSSETDESTNRNVIVYIGDELSRSSDI